MASKISTEQRKAYWAGVRQHLRTTRKTARIFGIEPTRFISARARKSANTIRDLFGDARQFCSLSEIALFRLAFPNESEDVVVKKVFAFMRDVHTCPPEVINLALLRIKLKQKGVAAQQKHLDAPIACLACNRGDFEAGLRSRNPASIYASVHVIRYEYY